MGGNLCIASSFHPSSLQTRLDIPKAIRNVTTGGLIGKAAQEAEEEKDEKPAEDVKEETPAAAIAEETPAEETDPDTGV